MLWTPTESSLWVLGATRRETFRAFRVARTTAGCFELTNHEDKPLGAANTLAQGERRVRTELLDTSLRDRAVWLRDELEWTRDGYLARIRASHRPVSLTATEGIYLCSVWDARTPPPTMLHLRQHVELATGQEECETIIEDRFLGVRWVPLRLEGVFAELRAVLERRGSDAWSARLPGLVSTTCASLDEAKRAGSAALLLEGAVGSVPWEVTAECSVRESWRLSVFRERKHNKLVWSFVAEREGIPLQSGSSSTRESARKAAETVRMANP